MSSDHGFGEMGSNVTLETAFDMVETFLRKMSVFSSRYELYHLLDNRHKEIMANVLMRYGEMGLRVLCVGFLNKLPLDWQVGKLNAKAWLTTSLNKLHAKMSLLFVQDFYLLGGRMDILNNMNSSTFEILLDEWHHSRLGLFNVWLGNEFESNSLKNGTLFDNEAYMLNDSIRKHVRKHRSRERSRSRVRCARSRSRGRVVDRDDRSSSRRRSRRRAARRVHESGPAGCVDVGGHGASKTPKNKEDDSEALYDGI